MSNTEREAIQKKSTDELKTICGAASDYRPDFLTLVCEELARRGEHELAEKTGSTIPDRKNSVENAKGSVKRYWLALLLGATIPIGLLFVIVRGAVFFGVDDSPYLVALCFGIGSITGVVLAREKGRSCVNWAVLGLAYPLLIILLLLPYRKKRRLDLNGRPYTKSGAEITTTFFPWALFPLWCHPKVEIDGIAHEQGWDTVFYPLLPGRHKVEVSFPYIFGPNSGYASDTVKTTKGQFAIVHYWMPPWAFLKGWLWTTTIELQPELKNHRTR